MICEIQVYIQKSFIGWKKRRDFNCVETNIITIQTTRALKSVHIDIIELLIIENVTGHSTLHNLGTAKYQAYVAWYTIKPMLGDKVLCIPSLKLGSPIHW